MNLHRIALASAALLAMIGPAQAATLYSHSFSGLGVLSSPGSINASFASASAGTGLLNFELAGFASLDGDNGYRDVFSLAVNGNTVFSGTFNLGGGGSNLIFSSPVGASVLVTTNGASGDVHNSTQVTWGGGMAQISLPVALLGGSNALSFSYASPGGSFAGPQSLADEGWGLNQVTVTSAIPEPGVYALMLAGLLGVAGVARRRLTQC